MCATLAALGMRFTRAAALADFNRARFATGVAAVGGRSAIARARRVHSPTSPGCQQSARHTTVRGASVTCARVFTGRKQRQQPSQVERAGKPEAASHLRLQ